MKTLFVGLIVVLAGGVFGWYFIKNGTASLPLPVPLATPSARVVSTDETQSAETQAPMSSGSVVYLDSGFSPEKITVKKGTSVVFTNQSSGSMWVASDVHPTHLVLPGFDQKKSEGKGSRYTYTFEQVGTWVYHNHVATADTGTVVVVAE